MLRKFVPIALAALGAMYFGCTNDFDQFDPGSGGGATTASGTGTASGATGTGGATTCTIDAGCDDMNPCTVDTCNTSSAECEHASAADGPVAGAMDAPNDCIDTVCAAGKASAKPDDTESADDGNDCTVDACKGGMKTNAPAASGSPCAAGQCNAMGQCVGCDSAEDCGVTDFCKQWTCDARVCKVAYAAMGTPLPGNQQTGGDCQELQCDGNGATVNVVANGDTPPNDGSECTDDVCSNGAPAHPPLPPDTSCGGGNICDGAGNCVECLQDNDCSGNETCDATHTCVCTPVTCAQLGLTCGTAPDGCGNTLDCDDNLHNGNETDVDCGGGGTCNVDCGLGDTCNTGGDCISNMCVDGVCCNSNCTGTCKTCNSPSNPGTCSNVTPPNPDPGTCSGNMACGDGGICKLANGQNCSQSGQCASGTCAGGTCQ